MRVAKFGIILSALISANFSLGSALDAKLAGLSILEEEAKKHSDLKNITPIIRIGEKIIKDTPVRIASDSHVSMMIPNGKGSGTLMPVYLNLTDGALYVLDPEHPKSVKEGKGKGCRNLSLTPQDDHSKSLTPAEAAERNFIRHFAIILAERHIDDPATAKFFEFYFPVSMESNGLVKKAITEGNDFTFGLDNDPVAQEKLFHFLARREEWTAENCGADGCNYKHISMGTIKMAHPGAADLVFDPSELIDPSEPTPSVGPSSDHAAASSDAYCSLDMALENYDCSSRIVFVLLTHVNCAPCVQLKSGAVWNNFVTQAAGNEEKKIFLETGVGDINIKSNIMNQYDLPLKYPQLIYFERRLDGSWKRHKKSFIGQEQIEKVLNRH